MHAVMGRHVALVELLLSHKANPFIKDALDKTALDYCSHMNDGNVTSLKQMINA